MHLTRRYIVNGEPTETLEHLLTRTKYHSCLDRGDRIYALLSLACKRDIVGIRPDYVKEPKDVYRDFVLSYTKNLGTLRLFNFIGTGMKDRLWDCPLGFRISPLRI